MDAPIMRPRTVGEILDAGISLYLRNARVLLTIAACVVVPIQIALGIVYLSVEPSGSHVPGDVVTRGFHQGGAGTGGFAVETVLSFVVREPHTARRSRRTRRPSEATTATPAVRERYGLEASAVTAQELAAVRQFLERRESLEPPARRELARRLASGLRDKVSSAPAELAGEAFLEALVQERTHQDG
jgi:hypothetical protein